MRSKNFSILTVSINVPRRSQDDLTVVEKEEAAATYYIKRAGVIGAMRAHVRVMAAGPVHICEG